MPILNILSNFWLFLKNPLDEPKEIKKPITLTLKLCVINTILAISSALMVLLLFTMVNLITGIDLKASTKGNILNTYSQFKFFWLGVLLAPIIEELCFRLPLRLSRMALSISLGLLIGVFLSKFILLEWDLINRLVLGFVVASTIYLITEFINVTKLFSKNKIAWLYYTSALIFGLIHIRNQEDITLIEIIFSPIITMPQIFMGLFLGYIRLSFGLKYSIFVHILNNFFVFLIKFL